MIGCWLLADGAVAELEAAYRLEPTAAQIEAFAARQAGSPLTVADGTGTIAVHGVLTEEPNIFAALFGGGNTSYSSVREALASADANPNVREIVLDIRSPGGNVFGLFETIDAIEQTKKPKRVRASLAASAAYALAAVAGPIEAIGPASAFGSIGVATSVSIPRDRVDIASSDAPKKRPDVSTEAGRAAVQEELDQLHELFVDAIARGRKTTAKSVNANYGRGGVLLASAARKAGMIDNMTSRSNTRPGATGAASNGSNMAAAEALGAQLGSATKPGAGESSAHFAERLLAGIAPPPPPKVDPAAVVAAYVLGEPLPDERVAVHAEGDPHADRVADLVVAAIREDAWHPSDRTWSDQRKTIGEIARERRNK